MQASSTIEGPFYFAARVFVLQRIPRVYRVDGLREDCQWWLDRAPSVRAYVGLAAFPALAYRTYKSPLIRPTLHSEPPLQRARPSLTPTT